MKKLDYHLILSGTHLDKEFGSTKKEVVQDNLNNIYSINVVNKLDPPASMAVAMSKIIYEVTKIIQKTRPSIFFSYGDRYETFAAAIAAHQNNTVLMHAEGGDVTSGGTHDDNIRHAISKLAHFHFPTNKDSYKRLLSLGEEKWRVNLVGFTAIDLIKEKEYSNTIYLKSKYNLSSTNPVILFTQHPISNNFKNTEKEIDSSIRALKKIIKLYNAKCFLTYPNSDAGSMIIIKKLKKFASETKDIILTKSLGRKDYWGILSLALDPQYKIVCVGNSSSGIKETPSFYCPTVNIGSRQLGRLQGKNVINCSQNTNEIVHAIKRSLTDNKFLKLCKTSKNPYGIGNA